MGTLTLWIAFNAAVALFLLLDLGLFHRQAHAVSIREAALESAVWVALSLGFGSWIFVSHGRGPGLEFFTGYVIEKSLSVDNVFIFILIFQYFRVEPRYQHRLLFWGVLGALVMRGAMIGVGTVLIQKFEWILYVFGAFLLYAGFKLFGADHTVHPEKNPVLHWVEKIIPITKENHGHKLFTTENGKWLATPLFLVVLVLETTDLVFAADSIPAVFGVTRDPFIVYTSNVCAILGLRAFYFLLAGILPYFHYLDDGLAVVLMFIGAKMLAEPWIHISTGISLGIVGGVIAVAVLISIWSGRRATSQGSAMSDTGGAKIEPPPMPVASPEQLMKNQIGDLTIESAEKRMLAAGGLFLTGVCLIRPFLDKVSSDTEFRSAMMFHRPKAQANPKDVARVTVGIAVLPDTFSRIRAANGAPLLADVPQDQDALEFELHFDGVIALDVLTTNAPGGGGAIDRFLNKFGEGIQQVEFEVSDVDRATEILRARFNVHPIYSATRPGANATRVNFFLVPGENGKKVLVELVESGKPSA